jgi:hypothetical protein
MVAILTMAGWADIAQYAFALTGAIALGFAWIEVRTNRASARRSRVYEYADAFNQMELLEAAAEHKERWSVWTVADLHGMTEVEQAKWMRLPNIIEEVAYLYNNDALDQDVAAELLGVYVERLWVATERLANELRKAEKRPKVFVDWERMQADTWKRRGAPAPLGVGPSIEPRSAWKSTFSAEYRRDYRRRMQKVIEEMS